MSTKAIQRSRVANPFPCRGSGLSFDGLAAIRVPDGRRRWTSSCRQGARKRTGETDPSCRAIRFDGYKTPSHLSQAEGIVKLPVQATRHQICLEPWNSSFNRRSTKRPECFDTHFRGLCHDLENGLRIGLINFRRYYRPLGNICFFAVSNLFVLGASLNEPANVCTNLAMGPFRRDHHRLRHEIVSLSGFRHKYCNVNFEEILATNRHYRSVDH